MVRPAISLSTDIDVHSDALRTTPLPRMPTFRYDRARGARAGSLSPCGLGEFTELIDLTDSSASQIALRSWATISIVGTFFVDFSGASPSFGRPHTCHPTISPYLRNFSQTEDRTCSRNRVICACTAHAWSCEQQTDEHSAKYTSGI